MSKTPPRGIPRSRLRVIHLAAAVPFLLHLYGPLSSSQLLLDALRLVIVPALSASGIVMWQQPRLLRALGRRRRARLAESR